MDGMEKVNYEDLRKVKSTNRRPSRWYTAAEVGTHCTIMDCWITISGIVFDLTSLFPINPPTLGEPLLQNAGKDISHWFEPRTFQTDMLEVLMWFHPTMRIHTYYCPQGRFIHIPPVIPRTDFNMDYSPWWQDPQYMIGNLSSRTRYIRIKNILLDHTYVMEVPSEETVQHILVRYSEHNAHAASYEWNAILEYKKGTFLNLDMNKSLGDNGVIDESDDFGTIGMPLDLLVPVLHIHYTDDLTVA